MAYYRPKAILLRRARHAVKQGILFFCVGLLAAKFLRNLGHVVRRLTFTGARFFLQRAFRHYTDAFPRPFRSPLVCGLPRLTTILGREQLFADLRLQLEDISTLAHRLLGDDPIPLSRGFKHGSVSPDDALAITLLRFAWPRPLKDLQQLTGFPEARCSDIIHTTSRLLVRRWWPCLASPKWLSESRLSEYARCTTAKGCPLRLVVGFIDGTRRECSKPSLGQSALYNGWLHNWSFLYVFVVFPDGTFMARGPVCGHENDIAAVRATHMDRDLPGLLRFSLASVFFSFNHNLILCQKLCSWRRSGVQG